MRVVIAGSSGLIGTALKEALHENGHTTVALVRREAEGDHESSWDPEKGTIDAGVLASADAVVNLAGASIGGKRLTPSHIMTVVRSRVDSTTTIATALADVDFDGVLMQGSAMGYYGSRGEEHLTEGSDGGDTLLADIAQRWEEAAAPAVEAGIRTVFMRTGLVLAPHGGFAERLLPLVKRGLLSRLGPGTAWHSWISLTDHVAAQRLLIDSDHSGPANLIAPQPVRDKDLIREMSRAAGKTPGLPVPAWALKLGVGKAAEDLLSSQRTTPEALKDLGFTWKHPEISDAAAWVMERA